MKKFFLYFMFGLFFAFSGTIFATYSIMNEKKMSADEVKKKWGNENSDLKKFKDAPYSQKAKMAYGIMTNKKLIGKSYEEIREIFGPNDGYYFPDTTPAYIVQEAKNRSEDTWQLVFKMDRSFKVQEIIMHKNCCEH